MLGLSRSFLRGPDGPCGGSTWTTPALRRSYRARETAGGNKIRITRVSTVSGEPRDADRKAEGGLPVADGGPTGPNSLTSLEHAS